MNPKLHDNYTYLSIPNAGYYGTDSKLKTLNSNSGGLVFEFSIEYINTVNMVRKIHIKNSKNTIIDKFLMNQDYVTPYYRINTYKTPNASLTTLIDMNDESGNIVKAGTTFTWTYSNSSFSTNTVTLIPIN